MTFVMRVVCLADGRPSGVDGSYLETFDVNSRSSMHGKATFTRDVDKAMRFPDHAAAMELWRQPRTVHPARRPDGELNRPLTAFTVSVEPAP